jgi:hypothetical protein
MFLFLFSVLFIYPPDNPTFIAFSPTPGPNMDGYIYIYTYIYIYKRLGTFVFKVPCNMLYDTKYCCGILQSRYQVPS